MKHLSNKGWLYMLPAIALLTVVGVIPLMTVINFSFHDIFTQDSRFWVGTEWYVSIVGSTRFFDSLVRSVLFSFIVITIQFPLGIAIALSLPRKGVWVSICLVVLSLPLLVPWNIIPIMWKMLLEPDTGLIGQWLPLFVNWDWKFNPWHTWISIVLMDIWHWTSLVVILCFSSLTTIAAPFYQAAAIDNASRWQVFRYVEFPRMHGVLLMALLLRFMDSFMIYTEVFYFNAGGPQNATMFLAVDLGEDIKAYNYGPAAARSAIYFLMVLCVAWCFTKALQQSET